MIHQRTKSKLLRFPSIASFVTMRRSDYLYLFGLSKKQIRYFKRAVTFPVMINVKEKS